MQLTRDNHFVPQSYLRRWSEDGQHIWCYSLLVSHANVPEWQRRSIRGVAFQRNLYTSSAAGQEVDEFEHWIEAEYETPAQQALERAGSGQALTGSDWEPLLLYVAAQDLRTPLNYIESVSRWHDQLPRVLQRTIEKAVRKLQADKRAGRKQKVKKASGKQPFADVLKMQIDPHARPETKEGEIRVSLVAGRHLWLESQKHLLNRTAKVLLSHKWSIIEAPSDAEWFTSDHPVVRVNYYGNGKYDLKGGWGNKGGNIIMPLSPKYLLFTQIGDKFPRRLQLEDSQASEIRMFIAERAHRMIFAHEAGPEVTQLRPRHVDPASYQGEQRAWFDWHGDQSRAENDAGNT
ncbi:MAG: DUF4238 domain-containing protein [Anaerolineales bacterium]|nr:DUF4238 domain-containing protein [Anaerolineales bacterium]